MWIGNRIWAFSPQRLWRTCRSQGPSRGVERLCAVRPCAGGGQVIVHGLRSEVLPGPNCDLRVRCALVLSRLQSPISKSSTKRIK
jgi:hypothetical protein